MTMDTSAPFRHRAAESGLTGALVRQVVISFYEKLRRDAILGPLFVAAVGDHWDAHIERIILFWLTATRLGDGYQGRNFMPAHLKHASIRIELIPRWLELFGATATEQCPSESASVLIDIATRMAETLQVGLIRRDER
jgi:hemoglobin